MIQPASFLLLTFFGMVCMSGVHGVMSKGDSICAAGMLSLRMLASFWLVWLALAWLAWLALVGMAFLIDQVNLLRAFLAQRRRSEYQKGPPSAPFFRTCQEVALQFC